jgi:hypothetical protein
MLLLDVCVFGADGCTIELVGKASAGYMIGIVDMVGQCINPENIRGHLYIIPLVFIGSFYKPLLLGHRDSLRDVLPRVAPSGPNQLVYVSNSVLPTLMSKGWVFLLRDRAASSTGVALRG